eukprot:TRINITY_DN65571_c0_g1_i1.p1 TRINITY_DN65571_c0_g1~~TRINITY_DN65571_c0_g1_i1.p1  ORF type:complete len:533 (-),score=82.99 TRINITY_DN65571_c0_g1_i1:126-1724(-)
MSSLGPLAAEVLAAAWDGAPPVVNARLARAACDCASAAAVAALARRRSVAGEDASKAVSSDATEGRAHLPLDSAAGSREHEVTSATASRLDARDQVGSADIDERLKSFCTPSEAVAIQLRCMQRARDDASKEVARSKFLERSAVRMEEDVRCRTELRRRLELLEKSNAEREKASIAKEHLALERLKAREAEVEKRYSALDEELSRRAVDLELQRRLNKEHSAEEHQHFERSFELLRKQERSSEELASQVACSERRLEEQEACFAASERDATHAIALAKQEVKAELNIRMCELDAEVNSLSSERDRLHGADQRLKDSDRIEKQLRSDLACAKVDLCAAEREAAALRARLDVLAGEVARTNRDVERSMLGASEARRMSVSSEEATVLLRSEALRDRLALRDAEARFAAQSESAMSQSASLRNELAQVRMAEKDIADEWRHRETSLQSRMASAHDREREALQSRIDSLQQARSHDALEIATLRRALQRQREDHSKSEAGWWRWVEEMRVSSANGSMLAQASLQSRALAGWREHCM